MQRVCRTCMQEVAASTCLILQGDAKSLQIKKKLQLCIPEMEVDVVVDPVLCQVCVKALHIANNFRNQCLQTESCIQRWIDDTKRKKSGICMVEVLQSRLQLAANDWVCDSMADTETTYNLIDDLNDLLDEALCATKQQPEETEIKYKDCGAVKELEVNVDCSSISQIQGGGFSAKQQGCKNSFGVHEEADYQSDNKKSEDGSCGVTRLDSTDVFVQSFVEHPGLSNNSSEVTSSRDQKLKEGAKVSKEQQMFKCLQCEFSTLSKHKLRIHVKIHNREKPFTCSVCGYRTRYKKCLKGHMAIHSGNLPFKCSYCKYMSAYRYNLRTHLKIHTAVKSFACNICDYKSRFKCDLQKHMRNHDNKDCGAVKDELEVNVDCSSISQIQGGGFSAKQQGCKNSFGVHEEADYQADDKKGEDGSCGVTRSDSTDVLVRSFVVHPGLSDNSSEVTSSRDQKLKEGAKVSKEKQMFKCLQCEFSTRSKHKLGIHVKIHSRENQLKCSICGFRTIYKKSLKRHMAIHSGNLPFKCSYCKYMSAYKCSLRNHLKIHSAVKPFACNICDYKSRFKCGLQKHMRNHDNKDCGAVKNELEVNVDCSSISQIQGGGFSAKQQGCKNSFGVHEEADYQADDIKSEDGNCGVNRLDSTDVLVRSYVEHPGLSDNSSEVTSSRDQKLKEGAKVSKEKQMFKCLQCEFSTRSKYKLEIHVKMHSRENQLKCSVCGFRTIYKKGLKRHMAIHSSNLPFKCSRCKYTSAYKCSLRNHLKTHSAVKPFACNICDYKSRFKCGLQKHMRNHDNKDCVAVKNELEVNVDCSSMSQILGGGFSAKQQGKNSFGVHEEADYQADDMKSEDGSCGVTRLDSTDVLLRSFVEHPGLADNNSEIISSRDQKLKEGAKASKEKQIFKCAQCKFSSPSKHKLGDHVKIHSREKPFKCSVCGYRTRYKKCLKGHMAIHSGNLPFKCSYCQYMSAYRYNLKSHLKIHSAVKSFVCNICDYKSRFKCDLQKHMRNHDNNCPVNISVK